MSSSIHPPSGQSKASGKGAGPEQEKDWAQQCQESSEESSGVLGSSGLLERGQSLSCTV